MQLVRSSRGTDDRRLFDADLGRKTPKSLRALGSETEKTVRDDQKSVDSDEPLRHNPAFFFGR